MMIKAIVETHLGLAISAFGLSLLIMLPATGGYPNWILDISSNFGGLLILWIGFALVGYGLGNFVNRLKE